MTFNFIWGEPVYGKAFYFMDLYDNDPVDFSRIRLTSVPQYVQMNQPPVGMRSNRKRQATEYHSPNSKR